FAASGLPPGLVISGTTGLISRIPSQAGTFSVVASVSDGVNSDTESFSWTVDPSGGGGPFTLNPPPSPPAMQSGSQASYTASSTGGTNVLYSWDFGDGSAPTAWSLSSSTSHAFSAPG